MPEATVIVTVHNAEKYLRECLDSVIGQTFSDIEILCMDGGSTDASPRILKEYAAKDNRVCIINDPNTSYGHKVNEGIRQAKGKYVSVLESDDMYDPDMLQRLYGIAEQYKADYVNGDYRNIFDIHGKRYQVLVKMYPEEDYGKLLESSKHPENMRQILRYWTGIFNREFLLKKDIRMTESPGASFQDMSFRFLISALADRAYHLEEPVYLYRVDNPGSSVYDPKKAVVIADEFDFLKRDLARREIKDPCIWRHFYTWKYNDFYGNLTRFSDEARTVLFERCYDEMEKDQEILVELFDEKLMSASIRDFLRKSKGEVWEDLEEIYRKVKEGEEKRYGFLENLGENETVIFGCGMRGRSSLTFFKMLGIEKQICCFTDNDKNLWGTRLDGYMVVPPSEAGRRYPDALFLIANKYHGDEIERQLMEMGIEETKIYRF